MVALLRTILALFVTWLFCAAAAAQDPANVVRVQCGSSVGSGVYLGSQICLSCAHVRDGEPSNRVCVRFPSGATHYGSIVKLDRTWDQSVIELETVPAEAGAKLSTANPQQGDPVIAAGYDFGRTLKLRRGTIQRFYSELGRDGSVQDWFSMTNPVVSGCSGGPIFDNQGNVIGNLWGSVDNITVGTMTGRTRRFLLPWNARLEAHWLTTQWGAPSGCGPQPIYYPPQQQPRGGGRAIASSPVGQPTPVPQPSPLSSPETVTKMIVDRLKQDQAFLAAIKGQDGKNGSDGRDGKDANTDEISSQLGQIVTRQEENATRLTLAMSRIDSLEAQVSALFEQPKPAERDNSQYTPSDLILYYTSRSSPGSERVDERIAEMKNNGWPIVITRLSPKDAEVQGVPRMYIPSKDKHVVGVSNCASYLSTLIKR